MVAIASFSIMSLFSRWHPPPTPAKIRDDLDVDEVCVFHDLEGKLYVFPVIVWCGESKHREEVQSRLAKTQQNLGWSLFAFWNPENSKQDQD